MIQKGTACRPFPFFLTFLNKVVYWSYTNVFHARTRKGILMKRTIRLIFAVALLLCCLTVTASAEVYSGKCGDYAYWGYDPNTQTLTISGEGNVRNKVDGYWEYRSKIKTIIIQEGITSLGDRAFEGYAAVSEVMLPKSLRIIGSRAFWGCSSLSTITLSEGLIWIEEEAFYYCDSLRTIELPNTVREIGEWAFRYSGLNSITIPESIEVIGENCFQNCVLENIILPGKDITYESGVFSYCKNLKSITIPEGITTLGESMFEGSGLTDIKLPQSLTNIKSRVFRYCIGLKKISLPDNITMLSHEVFKDSGLESVTIPESITVIPRSAFENCVSLHTINLPKTVVQISSSAFWNCDALTNITIPEGVENIEGSAFRDCNYLSKITLPISVSKIGTNAFLQCNRLNDVYYAGRRQESINIQEGNDCLTTAEWHYNYVPTPDAPTIKASVNTTTGKPKVSWTKVNGADLYRVYRATSKTGSYTRVKSTSSGSFTDTSAKAGKTYYYKVKAVNTENSVTSGYSNRVSLVCILSKPELTMKVDTASGKPKLVWDAVSGADEYTVYRATSKNGTYGRIAFTSDTTYIDKTANAGVNYYYAVRAVHNTIDADSEKSNVVSRVCDLAKPVVSIKLYKKDPRLTWDKISGAEKYYVYRATSKDGEYTHVKTTKSSTSFTDTTAKAGKTYYYKVKAIHSNSAANSAYSSVKYITAK